MEDPTLFDQTEAPSWFTEYHEKNPAIWRSFKNMTFRTIDKGFKHYSARAICQLIRWHTGIGADGEEFKVNNNMTPWYARKFMREFPKYEGFFHLRKSRVDKNQ